MPTTTLYRSVFVPLYGIPCWTVQECELALTFNVTPGEPDTRDCPKCAPTAELAVAQIKFPDNSVASLGLDRVEDLFGFDGFRELENEAIDQAGEEWFEQKQVDAEERADRQREGTRILDALLDA